MADVMEQGRAGREVGRACFNAGHANAAGPKTCWGCVDAALRDRERETAHAAAMELCTSCRVPQADAPLCYVTGMWLHADPKFPYRCEAERIWSRWPDYVPKAEGRE